MLAKPERQLPRISQPRSSRGREDAWSVWPSTKTLLRRAVGTLQAASPGEKPQWQVYPRPQQEGCKKCGPGHDRVLLVGNPNVGKSVIFAALTRRYVTVSNYPGTTVEITSAPARALSGAPELMDTPGTNSLIPRSEDERVTRDMLLANPTAPVVQVGDMKSLRRVLYLTVQLAELGARQLLVLNLEDEAQDLGVRVDHGELERLLGVPVIAATAVRGAGIDQIGHRLGQAEIAGVRVQYPEPLEKAAAAVAELLPRELGPARRGLAVMLLAGDRTLVERSERLVAVQAPGGCHGSGKEGEATAVGVPAQALGLAATLRHELEGRLGRSTASAVAQARHRTVERLVSAAYRREGSRVDHWRRRLGALTMHRVWGLPMLAAVLWVGYRFVGVFGAGTVVDWMENIVFGRVINPAAAAVLGLLPWHWLVDFLVGDYGLITMGVTYSVAIVGPVVLTFFIFFGLLEDSGYLPRLAVILNRAFRVMGLNGKAVLPMVLGLGCDTMATLTTRILASRKERILVTLLLALGVPCSAQMGVILAILSGVSPAGVAIWAGVVALTLVSVGWAAARVVPGRAADFLIELPPLRVPKLGNIMIKTLARVEWYLREAVPLFLIGTAMLWLLSITGALPVLERAAEPLVVGWLGLPAKAADAFLVGFLRRDYGAAGLYALAQKGMIDGVQTVVALVVITLFVPCIANLLVIVKERGARTALAVVGFIIPFAFLVGGVLRWALTWLGVTL